MMFLKVFLYCVILFVGCIFDSNTSSGNDDLVNKSTFLNRMKLIPAEKELFIMGVQDDAWWMPITQSVSLTHSFYMDSSEVTQKQYDDVMSLGYAGYQTPAWDTLDDKYGVGDNNPVFYVNWFDAVLYCNACSKSVGEDTVYSYTSLIGIPGNGCELRDINIDYTKTGFRLPTEAEWEFACRAGTTTDYYWGAIIREEFVWFICNSGVETHEIAEKRMSIFGLYDMSGNVFEWCNDWYGNYGTIVQLDPIGPTTGNNRIVRGGCWGSSVNKLRSGNRAANEPIYRDFCIGFRVCCLLSSADE